MPKKLHSRLIIVEARINAVVMLC